MVSMRSSTGSLVATATGLAFCWTLFRRTYPGIILANSPAPALSTFVFFAVQLLALCAVIAGTLIARQSPARITAALAALGFAASPLAFAPSLFGPYQAAAQLFGIVGFAAASPLLSVLWILPLLAMAPRRAYLAVALSFIGSFALSLLSLLPDPLRDPIFMTLPFVSVGLWLAVAGRFPPSQQYRQGERSEAPIALYSNRLIGIIILFILVGGIVRGLSSPTGLAFFPREDAEGILFRNCVSLLIATAFALWTYLTALQARSSVVGVLFACALFLAGLLAVSLQQDQWIQQGLSIVNTARNCLEYLLFVGVFSLLLRQRDNTGAALGRFALWYLAPLYLAQLVSYVAVPSLFALMAADSAAVHRLAFPCAVALAFGMLLFACGVLIEGERRPDHPRNAPEPSANGVAAIKQLARIQALTDRELEIALLLAQGNSYKKIAERLFISMSTVQSHTRNIYRKCAVNSRQELMDRLEETQRGTRSQ